MPTGSAQHCGEFPVVGQPSCSLPVDNAGDMTVLHHDIVVHEITVCEDDAVRHVEHLFVGRYVMPKLVFFPRPPLDVRRYEEFVMKRLYVWGGHDALSGHAGTADRAAIDATYAASIGICERAHMTKHALQLCGDSGKFRLR